MQGGLNLWVNPRLINPNNLTYILSVSVPYISKITNQIGRLLLRHNIKPISRSASKISEILPSPKDKLSHV